MFDGPRSFCIQLHLGSKNDLWSGEYFCVKKADETLATNLQNPSPQLKSNLWTFDTTIILARLHLLIWFASQTDYANTFNRMPFIIQSLSLIIFMIRLLLAVFTRTYTDSPNRRRYSTSINISGSLPITSIIPSYFLRKFLYNFRIYKWYFMHQC